MVINLNTGFYKDLDTNFAIACELSELDFDQEKIIEYLQNGNIPEKQIAALNLQKLNSREEAQILVKNLTGCDGKIREAVALKISQLLVQNKDYIDYFIFPEIFADATIDINGNICRLVIDSVNILKVNNDFKTRYLAKILSFIDETFVALDNFIFRDKKYVINKQLFKLYWCLETLKNFRDDVEIEKMLKILERASMEQEYTIREKVAQILINMSSSEFIELQNKLKEDENYYVREVFKN